MKTPHFSIIFPGESGAVGVDNMEGMYLPRVGERLMIPKWTYKNGNRDTCNLFEGVVMCITHAPHPEYPQIWIKLRKLNFFERNFY